MGGLSFIVLFSELCLHVRFFFFYPPFVRFPFWPTISRGQQLPPPRSPPLSPGLLHFEWKPTLALGGAGLGPCYACSMMDGQEN